MTTKADATRAQLVDAGERIVADHGVDGATVAEITRAAGQRNGAAIHYHFGGRDALLDAIVERHSAELDDHRADALRALVDDDAVTVANLVEVIVATMATRLDSDGGRAFLAIQARRSTQSGGALLTPSAGMRSMRAALAHVLPTMDAAVQSERADLVATMVTGRLARRAEEESTERELPARAVIVRVLVDAATAILTASDPFDAPHRTPQSTKGTNQ